MDIGQVRRVPQIQMISLYSPVYTVFCTGLAVAPASKAVSSTACMSSDFRFLVAMFFLRHRWRILLRLLVGLLRSPAFIYRPGKKGSWSMGLVYWVESLRSTLASLSSPRILPCLMARRGTALRSTVLPGEFRQTTVWQRRRQSTLTGLHWRPLFCAAPFPSFAINSSPSGVRRRCHRQSPA